MAGPATTSTGTNGGMRLYRSPLSPFAPRVRIAIYRKRRDRIEILLPSEGLKSAADWEQTRSDPIQAPVTGEQNAATAALLAPQPATA